MTFTQELYSWLPPTQKPLSSPPTEGSNAPSTPQLEIPTKDKKPLVITFLRHCGCPFAEQTFRELREIAAENPDVTFVAVSHSDSAATEKWLEAVGGTSNGTSAHPIEVIVDADRELYARWGLGVSSWAHVLKPSALMAVYTLGRSKGIWNRPTESGSRWQTAGSWSLDGNGVVKWAAVAESTDDIPNFREAVWAVKNHDAHTS